MATLTSCRTGKALTWRSHGSNARYFIRKLFPDRVLDFEHFALRRKDMPELTYPKRYLSDDHEDWREEVFKLLWKDEELKTLAENGWTMTETGSFSNLNYPRSFLKVLADPAAEHCPDPIGVYIDDKLAASTDLSDFLFLAFILPTN